MQSGAVGFFALMIGSAACLGFLGLSGGFTAVVCLRRGGIRGRSGRLYFGGGPRQVWTFALLSMMTFAVCTPVAGCAVYAYVSEFKRQGTWPVADHALHIRPRRGMTAR